MLPMSLRPQYGSRAGRASVEPSNHHRALYDVQQPDNASLNALGAQRRRPGMPELP